MPSDDERFIFWKERIRQLFSRWTIKWQTMDATWYCKDILCCPNEKYWLPWSVIRAFLLLKINKKLKQNSEGI